MNVEHQEVVLAPTRTADFQKTNQMGSWPSRGAFLLTGATGMLGGYLLRDCRKAGHRMAALVRNHPRIPAGQRVASMLARLDPHRDDQCFVNGKAAQPVVLCGDLTQVNLGLDADSIDWIARNCDAIIHNAASLQFEGPNRQGEPWRTNVAGTQRMLDLCRNTGIRHLHHVSTAYVCGLRSGCVLEEELDAGQAMSNDYERSKLEAEQMVRQAGFLDTVTIYRPGIIVGDSKTGQTTGYHGFYALLKLVHTLASRVERGATNEYEFITALGFTHGEIKHLVPVDWVSAVIVHILSHPEYHGRTYHLTSSRPTPAADIAQVIQEAVELYSPMADARDPDSLDVAWMVRAFGEQAHIYHVYFREDPRFDQRNTRWAAPHLPCPVVDRQMLMRMAQAAIASRFGRAAQARRTSEVTGIPADGDATSHPWAGEAI